MLHIYLPPNCPFPFDDLHLNLVHPSLDRPHSPPKLHSDPISRFATVYPPDRPTDRQDRQINRQTNRWDWRQVCINTRLRSIDCIATRLKNGTSMTDQRRPSVFIVCVALIGWTNNWEKNRRIRLELPWLEARLVISRWGLPTVQDSPGQSRLDSPGISS